jgi:hypothetical protein
MSRLAEHVAFVKEQADFHDKMAEKFANHRLRSELHKATAGKFRALFADLMSADSALDSPPAPARKSPNCQSQLSLSMADIEDLPQELIDELGLSDADKTEFAIISAIEEAGGIISLNKLLIALYRSTGEIHRRQSLYPRLARMVQKNSIYYVPGKKGVYSVDQLSNEDVLRLFGVAREDEETSA